MADELAPAEGLALVAYARAVVRAELEGAPSPRFGGASPAFSRTQGAFVSLHRGDALRGCIGHLRSTRSVVEVVAECALAAAFHDPRFPPVLLSELDELTFEVSVLSPLRPARAEEIEAGHHGVVLMVGGRSAVFLPQVASEFGWNRETLLTELCRKARLEPGAWRASDARLEVFTAAIYHERAPG